MKSCIRQVSLGFSLSVRKTLKASFLDEMGRVVPWARLVDLVAPHYPEGRTGRPPFALETMLHTHFLQEWLNLSDPAMQEAFFDTPLYREFVGLDDNVRLVEVNAILSERGLMLKEGSAVEATLVAARSSTKNKGKNRDPEMHSSQKGSQWHFGMTSRRRRTPAGRSCEAGCGHKQSEAAQLAHIGVDADSGLVHTVRCTSGHVSDVTQAHRLLHGQEKTVWADAGYQGVEKREGADPNVTWHVAMRPGKRKVLKHAGQVGEFLNKAEKLNAGIRAKVEHPFRVLKRQFGYMKTRYRGLTKNAAQIATLFALSNLWMAGHDLMEARA